MIFELGKEIAFPPVEYSEDDGLLAFGGDLSVERLLTAYSSGIFPWFNPSDPILWWSPDPRPLFYPNDIKPSKSLRQIIRRKQFKITFDHAFEEVLNACSSVPRNGQYGTWLTKSMKKAYLKLHQMGYCHSVEAWQNDKLVGGLYGVSIGRNFVGESMFHKADNASKVAFFHLNELLKSWDFHFIDGQVSTPHLLTLGAIEVKRTDFIIQLNESLKYPTKDFLWDEIETN